MAENDAPFGLHWGESQESLVSQGVTLERGDDGPYGQIVSATGVPKPIQDVESIALFFTDGGKLWRIVGVFKANTGDPFGSLTLKRYSELKDALTKRYGRPNEAKFINSGFSSENFVLGLSSGDNYLYSDFSSPDVSVQLGVRAAGLGESFCILIYESKGLKSVFDSERRAREMDAL